MYVYMYIYISSESERERERFRVVKMLLARIGCSRRRRRHFRSKEKCLRRIATV